MSNSQNSSSAEQQYAGLVIFEQVQKKLGFDLQESPKLYLSDNLYTYIQPDFYSEEHGVIGEIFAHVGKPKRAQDNKIANDILKMLLFDDVKGKKHRKIVVVCDEAEENKLRGLSAIAESIRRFNIELMRIDIDDDLREKILNAQKRQRMINE